MIRFASLRCSWLVAMGLGLFALCAQAQTAPPAIYLAYPRENATVAFDHVLLEGSVPAGATLQLDGRAIDVGSDGLFIEWVPLRPGRNLLQLESDFNGQKLQRQIQVTSAPPQALPATPTTILSMSIQPATDLKLFDVGSNFFRRTLQVRFTGSLGGSATFKVGDRGPFPMLERRPENFPGATSILAGTYEGTFVMAPTDTFQNAPVVVTLVGTDGQSVSSTATGTLSVAASPQPRVGIVIGEPLGIGLNGGSTAARNGAGRTHILQLKPGVKLVMIGEEEGTYCVALSDTQTVNVPTAQVRLLPPGAPIARAYFSRIGTRQIANATGRWTQVRFNLPDRFPFSIEQAADAGGQHLEVRIYGVESDVDYLEAAFPDDTLRGVTWLQEADGVFKARLHLAPRQQWGYNSFYDGNTLVLQVKHTPTIDRSRPLRGRHILIDPGHGGSESGAAGAFGVNEKDINLDIARRLVAKLRARGADARLTRDKDVTVPLYDRPLLAENTGAELLVSVHANALGDGSNPNLSRGSGVYYYQPQAQPLAETLLASLLKQLPEVGNDGLHYQNLALTRPSSQISVLVETAFMTDKGNLRVLMSDQGRERFATAIGQGIEEFYRRSAQGAKR